VNELALFAGHGGGILGGLLLGWRTVCAVEIDPVARSVLLARQNDACLRPFAVWDDIRTFDGRPWRGAVDVVSGGFPCQPFSTAARGRNNAPISGLKCFGSCARSSPGTSSRRTSSAGPSSEPPRIYERRATPPALLRSIRPSWLRRIAVSGGGWLPTPTAKANHDAPSMRKWPAYATYQDWLGGKTCPRTGSGCWGGRSDGPTTWHRQRTTSAHGCRCMAAADVACINRTVNSMSRERDILQWLTSEDTGTSSKTLAYRALGQTMALTPKRGKFCCSACGRRRCAAPKTLCAQCQRMRG
jgi:hypothetical protein